jgi:alkylation response protein AidB-like acyl-CoA dehydrogenase
MSTELSPPNDDAERRKRGSPLAEDARGLNLYRLDRGLRDLLDLYLDADLRRHLDPHLDSLGERAAGELDQLARLADRNPPLLRPRDRFGRDEESIELHPSYRELRRIAFCELGLHAISHRAGVLGWERPLPPLAKYALEYLFVQAEFGLLCPDSLTDTSIHLLVEYGSPELQERFLPHLLSTDPNELWTAAQFITEKSGGSDVGAIETVAVPDGDGFRLWGEKWFCSNADADLALVLARPEGAATGTAGLGLFAMPRLLDDGRRNRYRIVRLKDKLGTRSMPSGEIVLEGALAWVVGDLERGLKQMLEQVNLSRLSHGMRAAGMMRRCWHEARQAALTRRAFGGALVDKPLVRRELLEILLPAEQALTIFCHAAHLIQRAPTHSPARTLIRILTPALKYRACRDNLRVATAAMEMRGGNGYIEEWIEPRLIRDAQIGVLWEGTSNVVALDLLERAVGRLGAQAVLAEHLLGLLDEAELLPLDLRVRLQETVERVVRFVEEAAAASERAARDAASAVYHVTSAVLFAWEAATLAASGGDARRLLLARLVLDYRLGERHPLRLIDDSWEREALELLMGDSLVPLSAAVALAES